MARRFTSALEQELGGGGAWSSDGYLQTFETTAELRWPSDVAVYDIMRRTDSEIGAVLRAVNTPIRRTAWRVAPSSDVRPEVHNFVEVELGLSPEATGRHRLQGQGITWDQFIRHALLYLPFGHMFFEPVYQVGPPGPGEQGLPTGQLYAHLSRLGPRLPRTLTGIDVADNGDLAGIRQMIVRQGGYTEEVKIPASRLVPFCNEREGSDWSGTSILRTAYKHWMLKEILERLGPQTVERNGMGVPVVKYPEGGDRSEALKVATQFRAGEQAGIAVKNDWTVELLGVQGTLPDGLPLTKYHQQAIGRSALAMFLDLGQDRGARALAETFVDFFTIGVNAVMADLEETATEAIVRPLVALNFGDSEPYPEIQADEITPQAPLTADAIALLVTSGIVTVDEPLEIDVRRRFGLPPLAVTGETAPVTGEDDTLAVSVGGGGGSMSAPDPLQARLSAARQHLAHLRR